MNFKWFFLAAAATALGVSGVAYGMNRSNGNGPPSRVAYLHILGDGTIDTARTSRDLDVTFLTGSGGVACIDADFVIKGGSLAEARNGGASSGPAFNLRGAQDAPDVFGPGKSCGDAQAEIFVSSTGIYAVLVG